MQTMISKKGVSNNETVEFENANKEINRLFNNSGDKPVSPDVLGQVNNVMTNELTQAEIVARGQALREMNQEYQVKLNFGGPWGSTDVTIPPSTVTGSTIAGRNNSRSTILSNVTFNNNVTDNTISS